MARVFHRDRRHRRQHHFRAARPETRAHRGATAPRVEERRLERPFAARRIDMTPTRKRRLYWVLGILAGVSIAGALALSAFQKNVMFFFDPTQVAAGEVKQGQRFRLGGMVTKGSFHRVPGSLEVSFIVTDFKNDLSVKYSGVLPDLFREGQGVVAHGKLGPD